MIKSKNEELEKILNLNKEISEDYTNLKKEKKTLKEEMDKKEEEWIKEKTGLEKRISDLQAVLNSDPNTRPMVVKESVERVGSIFESLMSIFNSDAEKEDDKDFYTNKIAELENQLKKREQEHKEEMRQMQNMNESQIEHIRTSKEMAQSRIKQKEEETLQNKIDEMQNTIFNLELKIKEYDNQDHQKKLEKDILDNKNMEIKELKETIETLRSQVKIKDQEIKEFEQVVMSNMKRLENKNIHSMA